MTEPRVRRTGTPIPPLRAFPILLLVVGLLAPAPVPAQPPGGHSVMGQVIDAKTGEGLSGATAVLAPLPEGVLGNRGASPWLPSGRTTTTTDDGGYAFHGLSAGSYALLVSRMDYKPARLDIEVSGARAHVSVGLVVDPIVMEPREVLVRSSTDARPPTNTTFGTMDRLAMEKARQATA